MAANKKRRRSAALPPGFGSVRYTDARHDRPYYVYPPSLFDEEDGLYHRPPALCSCRYRQTGISVLTAWHAGNYKPGMEEQLDEALDQMNRSELRAVDDFTCAMLSDFRAFKRKAASAARLQTIDDEGGPTFEEVFLELIESKFGPAAPKQLSANTRNNYSIGLKAALPLYDRPFKSVTLDDLQGIINAEGKVKKSGTLSVIKNTWTALYKYAMAHDLAEKNIGSFVVIPARDDQEHGQPFSAEDIRTLWDIRYSDETAEMLLIMIYSGFRISAYQTLEVNTDEGYFKGGVKTAAGKDRIVPIHPCIAALVKARLERLGGLLPMGRINFDYLMKKALAAYGLSTHSPHDCRHTFSALCERYGVNEADRKRMMGHSFGGDITNGVYGHRTLDDLRKEIVKIPCPEGF